MPLRLLCIITICVLSRLATAQGRVAIQIQGDQNYKITKDLNGTIAADSHQDGAITTLDNLRLIENKAPSFWDNVIVDRIEIPNVASQLCAQINELPGKIATESAFMADQVVPAIDSGGYLVYAAFETPANSSRILDSIECHSARKVLCTVVNRSTRRIVSENCRLDYNTNSCVENGIRINMDQNMSNIDVSFNGVERKILPASDGYYAELKSLSKVGPYFIECGDLN